MNGHPLMQAAPAIDILKPRTTKQCGGHSRDTARATHQLCQYLPWILKVFPFVQPSLRALRYRAIGPQPSGRTGVMYA